MRNESPISSACFNCKQIVEEDMFCHGCKAYICIECGLNEAISGFGHSADNHLVSSECCGARIGIDYTCFDCAEPCD